MMVHRQRWLRNTAALITILLAGFWATTDFTLAAEPSPALPAGAALAETTAPPLCRFGVNAPSSVAPYDVGPLRVGWYLTYGATASPARPGGIEYQPLITIQQTGPDSYTSSPSGTQLDAVIAANPGAVWYIGNEPDRRVYQNDAEPGVYARAYHDLYTHIKSLDPTARIFAGSIVQPTPLRLKYLDLILDAYSSLYQESMPVDGWSIHNFILNEASCDYFPASQCWGAEIPPGLDDKEGLRVDVQDNDNFTLFVQQIERFRQWMVDRGYGGLPVYLSEYGVLMPANYGFNPDFTPARVNSFMDKTFDYLLNTTDPVRGDPNDGGRLIQRFSWFSTDDTQFNGRLFEPDTKQRTAIGDNYAAYTAPIAAQADFYPARIVSDPPGPISPVEPVTLTLKTTIANSGNTLAAYDVTVQFYDGDPNAGGQQIGADQTVAVAGCGDNATAEVSWANVLPGVHRVWVRVTPTDANAPEAAADKANNTASSTILIATDGLYMPTITR